MIKQSKVIAEAFSIDPYKVMANNPLIVRAEGCWLYDELDRRYFDSSGGSGAVNLGHQHPDIVSAIKQQAERLLHTGWNVPNDKRNELVQKLGQFAPYDDCAILLAVSGTEAAEAALKVARAATGRTAVIAFDRAFHGKSTGALGVTWRPSFRTYSTFDREQHLTVPYPLEGIGDSASVTAEQCLEQLSSVLRQADMRRQLPAAMIMEPIQVSEGIHPAGPAFLQQAVDIARSFGIIVIFDEIYTGFGRVGAKFYCDRTGIIPDLLMIGKGLGNGVPISAVLGSSAIMNAMPPGHHSSTFAANPLSCAAGTAVLDVMNETSIWNNAEKVGSQLMHSLERLRQSSGIISKPRGEGLLIGFDMLDNEGNASPAKARLFADLAMDRGILLRWGGYSGSTIKVTPPLTMNQAELDFLSSSFTDIADVIQAKEN